VDSPAATSAGIGGSDGSRLRRCIPETAFAGELDDGQQQDQMGDQR